MYLFNVHIMMTTNRILKKCRQVVFHSRWSSTVPGLGSFSSGEASSRYSWRKPIGEYTGITIYNHSLRSKVPLVFRNPHFATWYTCGPTVYDSAHLGHASTYVKVDILQRIMRDYFKINLVTAMNITDVDDKIIKRSRETGRDWKQLTSAYDAEFKEDMRRLNVQPPDFRTNVTNNIPAIVLFILDLLNNKMAYVTEDHSVYFDVTKYPYYGKLEKINMSVNEQQQLLESNKSNAADFALWKAKKDADEPSWPAPWGGEGRPGWHIECSAIAGLFFGQHLDFHAGGLDLRFPHHENEEAQCCARFNTDQWVNYWLHTGQLHVQGQDVKMSKSLGNTISVSQLLEKYTADEFRMACLLSKYRSPMTFSDQLMITARQTLQKFRDFHADLNAYTRFLKPLKLLDEVALKAQLKFTVTEFDTSLRDDFDTARAINVLIDQMSSISRCINEQQADAQQDAAHCLDLLLGAKNFICNAMQTFGIKQLDTTEAALEHDQQLNTTLGMDVNALLGDVVAMRGKLREEGVGAKNVQLLRVCDDLRHLLQKHGIELRDHKQGTSWVFKNVSDRTSTTSNAGIP
ncbi:probable cysteine--tRNA ligase, mitochondrial [Scaptodrosophila lebanonensis]|uniref:cysteine--tRNA ligase n=1 Tax=Drosophila lebanonensis TaxID=7225 RepID=A0A6J2T0T7_DROLE|nr:probable cysteine--tRNA ligase, mitochondrial [Scaptodrosophila lebanonensis]